MIRHALIAAIAFALTGTAWAGENAPERELLYNTTESNSLTTDCSTRGDELHCEFTQVRLMKAALPGDLEKALKEGRETYGKGERFSEEECKAYGTMLDVLNGKQKAPREDALAKMSAVERRDALGFAQAAVQFCRAPAVANYLALVRLDHEKKARTCTVASFNFKQTFKRVSDLQGRSSWVVQDTPTGPCGVIQLSRFEPVVSSIGDAKFTLWKYFSRKAVTNPKGQFFGNMSCAELDQQEYEFDWRGRDLQMGCDYIKFSPL